jgi:DNA polymerase-3 subunit delta'
MSANDSDTPHPRQTGVLFGHGDAERTLLDAYRSGHMPHAWLIGGPRGIGKATLAYRMARFVLAHPDPAAAIVQEASSLAIVPDNPAARRVMNEAHPDLLVLQRTINEKTGKLYQDIVVDDIRRTVPFFGSTAGEGGWRVAIVDSVEELNRSGENALLKVLEEPPPKSLLLLVSNAPGRMLPTIRSRCRSLLLRPLSPSETAQAVAVALGRSADDAEIGEAAAAAGGSVGRALDLLDGPILALRKKVTELLAQLPSPNPQALHALGDSLGYSDPAPLTAFIDQINEWLTQRLDGSDMQRMAQIAQTWETINGAARDVEAYNLERKSLVFSVFGLLTETVGPQLKA